MSGFPEQPEWFRDNRGFENIFSCLRKKGFVKNDENLIAGLNWLEFLEKSFKPLIKK